MKYTKIIRKILIGPVIAYLALVLWTITFGQSSPFEFKDNAFKYGWYEFIFWFTPVVICIVVFMIWKTKSTTSFKAFTTVVALILIPVFLVRVFKLTFLKDAGWRTIEVLYVNSTDSYHRIEEQYIDLGIASGNRTVEIEPFTPWFYDVKRVYVLPNNDPAWIPVTKSD